jgi:hypothetical protein
MSLRNVTSACAFLLVISACGGDDEVVMVPGVIDRETFISAYVDLRSQTLEGSEISLPVEERDRILATHGIDADDLMGFVDAYGRDLDFIRDVWDDVEQRLDSLSAPLEPDQRREPS